VQHLQSVTDMPRVCGKCGGTKNPSGYCPGCYQIRKYGSSHSESIETKSDYTVQLSNGSVRQVYERSNGSSYYMNNGRQTTVRSNQKLSSTCSRDTSSDYSYYERSSSPISLCHSPQLSTASYDTRFSYAAPSLSPLSVAGVTNSLTSTTEKPSIVPRAVTAEAESTSVKKPSTAALFIGTTTKTPPAAVLIRCFKGT